MALTINPIRAPGRIARLDVPGDQGLGVVELVGDTSYPAGGYAITPGLFGLQSLDWFVPMCCNIGVVPVWDQVNQKVKLFYPSGGGAAAAAFPSAAAIASGATAVTSAAANGATDIVPGVGIELPATTNVSTVKIYCILEGR